MNTVETALVILLSIGFLTLLILSIVLITILVGIMRNVRRISQRAEEASGNLAGIVSTVRERLAPIAMSGLVGLALKWIKRRKEE